MSLLSKVSAFFGMGSLATAAESQYQSFPQNSYSKIFKGLLEGASSWIGGNQEQAVGFQGSRLESRDFSLLPSFSMENSLLVLAGVVGLTAAALEWIYSQRASATIVPPQTGEADFSNIRVSFSVEDLHQIDPHVLKLVSILADNTKGYRALSSEYSGCVRAQVGVSEAILKFRWDPATDHFYFPLSDGSEVDIRLIGEAWVEAQTQTNRSATRYSATYLANDFRDFFQGVGALGLLKGVYLRWAERNDGIERNSSKAHKAD